jgi:L-ribulose-5-phosphate 4-epimerase
MLLPSLREQVCLLHRLLPAHQLVTWTSGNLSARDPDTQLIVIKPSGIHYEQLTPANLVVVDEEGTVVEGTLRPSSDTLSHCYLYRHLPHIGGVVHTHSRYATAFAAVGQSIPCVLTAMADEFGGAIPCGGLAPIGGDEIGRQIITTLETSQSPAVLLQNHGVFTLGASAEAAVKAAIMTEDVAATVWHALQLGQPIPLPDELIARLHQRYSTVYGQPEEVAR